MSDRSVSTCDLVADANFSKKDDVSMKLGSARDRQSFSSRDRFESSAVAQISLDPMP